jgi:hypothetical protein
MPTDSSNLAAAAGLNDIHVIGKPTTLSGTISGVGVVFAVLWAEVIDDSGAVVAASGVESVACGACRRSYQFRCDNRR